MLFVAMAAMLPASMSAYDFKEGDIYYNVNGNEVAVTYEIVEVGSYSGDVVIPETVVHNGVEYAVTAIGYKAFANCYNMTSIEIPNSIDSISSHAFKYCEALQRVVIPNSVVTLYPCAFYSCTGLKSVVIGNSVSVIDEYCFQYCYQLEDVVIGSSVTYLAIKAFYDCYSLRDITCLATTPPAMYEWSSFDGSNYYNATLHVPASSLTLYQTIKPWSYFFDIQPIPDVDGDGILSINDVVTIINYLLTRDLTDINLDAADVDGDGRVNIDDVTALIDYLLRGIWSN